LILLRGGWVTGGTYCGYSRIFGEDDALFYWRNFIARFDNRFTNKGTISNYGIFCNFGINRSNQRNVRYKN